MAGASAKRVAADNETALRNLRYGMIISSGLYVTLRILFRAFPPSIGQVSIYILTLLPTILLYQHLNNTGTPRRDPTTGAILSPGENLNQPGLTESCWDIIYVTWACQVGSSVLGDWFWWLYLVIPLYACFKLYTSVIKPLFFKSSPKAAETEPANDDQSSVKTSKRQEKLQKRNEKRTVQTQSSRR